MTSARQRQPAAILVHRHGHVWLDDVVLTESAVGQQWFPQISTEGVKNFVPNSSFECGTANWGSFTYGLERWAGNLYRLEGEPDAAVAQHGRHSLRIALIAQDAAGVTASIITNLCAQPVRRVLAANQGWFRVEPGEKLTLSAFMRADAEGVAGATGGHRSAQPLAAHAGHGWQRMEAA